MILLDEYTILHPAPRCPEVKLEVVGVGEVDEAGDLAATDLSRVESQSTKDVERPEHQVPFS